MSGAGRKSQYRKHLTDAVLHDLPEPEEGQQVAQVVATRGGNQFEIQTAQHSSTPQLAILPTKFHKLVWIKRKDYVIVQGGEEDGEGIRYLITHILYKEQIKHLKSKGLWPSEFDDEKDNDDDDEASEGKNNEKVVASPDGIVYDHGLDENDDEDIFVNTNRIAKIQVQDSESESSSSDDDA